MSWLVPHLRRARRLLAALCCRWDIHDLPPGYHRVAPADPIPGLPISYAAGPIWDVGCRWCHRRFTAQADARHDALAASLKRGMARQRPANDTPSRDRRPS